MAAQPEKKEKKPRPAPPAPSAPLATASLLIRSAAAKVMGLKVGPAGGEMQPIWVSEPGKAKVTIDLSECGRDLKKDETFPALLQAIEKISNELVASNGAVSLFSMEKAAAEKKYGDAIYDAKSAKADSLRLAYVPDAFLVDVASNWSLCASAGDCGKICFEYGEEAKKGKKQDTMILVAGKKKQCSIKFSVANPDAAGVSETANAQPSGKECEALNTGDVTVEVAVEAAASAATEAAAGGKEEEDAGEMVVDPWEVKGKIDYNRLVKDFGTKLLRPDGDDSLIQRLEKQTVGKGNVSCLHRFLRRNIFFSHRDLDQILSCCEKGIPFYLYTGRGPSSASMHLGHLIPFMMTQWLQEAFNVPLVIQMTDDEKFLWKGEYHDEKGDNLMHYRDLTTENAKDIIACGFDKSKTFIFSDLEYVGHMYPNIVRIQKAITYNTARSLFGFQGDNNIGQSAFPAVQAAPSFPTSFNVPLRNSPKMACLIPCAIDQDNYFRATRDIAHKLVPKDHPLKGKPALIHSKFFPPLQGAEGKMSASNTNSAIFLTDSAELIKEKINKHALSGGQMTAKEQREKGANLDLDVPYQWLRFFLEDDAELDKIGKEYGTGQGDYWNTGAVKNKLVEVLQTLVAKHQERRAKITDEEVAEWMRVRELQFK